MLSKKKERATQQSTKKSCFWNYALLFFLHYYFKNPKILNFFLPLPWPHYNMWKVLMIFECIFFWKFVNIRILLSIMSVYLHGYFEWKHKPKTLKRILVRKYTFNLSAFFHNWLSCEFKRLTQVWKIEFFHLCMHDNFISRILICLK